MDAAPALQVTELRERVLRDFSDPIGDPAKLAAAVIARSDTTPPPRRASARQRRLPPDSTQWTLNASTRPLPTTPEPRPEEHDALLDDEGGLICHSRTPVRLLIDF